MGPRASSAASHAPAQHAASPTGMQLPQPMSCPPRCPPRCPPLLGAVQVASQWDQRRAAPKPEDSRLTMQYGIVLPASHLERHYPVVIQVAQLAQHLLPRLQIHHERGGGAGAAARVQSRTPPGSQCGAPALQQPYWRWKAARHFQRASGRASGLHPPLLSRGPVAGPVLHPPTHRPRSSPCNIRSSLKPGWVT